MFGASDEDEASRSGVEEEGGVEDLGASCDRRGVEASEVLSTGENAGPAVNSESVYSDDPIFTTKEEFDAFMLNYKPVRGEDLK